MSKTHEQFKCELELKNPLVSYGYGTKRYCGV